MLFMSEAVASLSFLVGLLTTGAVSLSLPSAESSASNVPFTLRYVPGFFKQGTASIDRPTANPDHFGLLTNVSWSDVDIYIDMQAARGVQAKLFLFLRHGQGIHNVAEAQYGTETWERYYRKLGKYTDARLTALGIQQVVNASDRIDTELENGLRIEGVVVSPLERTLHTSMIAYRHHDEIPKHSMEWPRETIGICTCDLRGTISSKAVQYPSIDFDDFWSDADPWWSPNKRESELHIDDRARIFLNRVFYGHKSTHMGVVTHGGLTNAAMRVIGHRMYSVSTAEVIPFLLEDKRPFA
ncbi:hypothetical protein JM18_009427 [Phytophthora kernoviae]|uniref:Uncharacterized protein n=2 Tax=Phytophthora kernoviae TaxID=325452 RepID=A0A8T0LIZ9_9STRA|nr:hypothetical protein G195_011186 [Phytophthora kernoviae 00238/432]KAG2502769.1 hypothetical protein JM16_009253 [Phytophthora kernoviae]KAG2503071.1 hypothetical protein JM18_009427 [Phytophthora kernoviae]